jgi:predicted MPP superfamily phosphohydrolase
MARGPSKRAHVNDDLSPTSHLPYPPHRLTCPTGRTGRTLPYQVVLHPCHTSSVPLTRRDALRGLIATGVGIAVGPLAYGAAYERHRLVRVDQDLPVSGLPPALDGLRIGLITDVHYSATVSAADVTRAVEMLRSAGPDLVVLGGDYVTFGNRHYVEPVAELLAPLAFAPLGSFAVLGNHDNDREMAGALARRKFVVLRDERTRLIIRDEPVDLVGIRFWTRRVPHLLDVMKGAGPNTILLAHDPRRLTQAAQLNVPLVLSGHTHGGQVLIPGLTTLVQQDFPTLAGLKREENTSLFVSRGVGTVYVPIRLNCPPEIAVLTLRPLRPTN